MIAVLIMILGAFDGCLLSALTSSSPRAPGRAVRRQQGRSSAAGMCVPPGQLYLEPRGESGAQRPIVAHCSQCVFPFGADRCCFPARTDEEPF